MAETIRELVSEKDVDSKSWENRSAKIMKGNRYI